MKTILVVDDEVYTRLLFSDALSTRGYTVITAATGEEALRAIRQFNPHLVLLDIKMSGTHGIEVLKRMRKEHFTMPVIIITAYGGMEKDYDVVTSDIAAYITKPVDLEVVYQKIKEILGE